MKTVKTLFILMLGICFSTQAQQYYAVATEALVVRSKADPQAIKTGILYMGDVVEVLENTGISFELTDNGKKIKGNWVKVKSDSIPIGFVFDGFLIEKKIYRENEQVIFDEEYPIHSKVSFENIDVIIYNYQTQDDRIEKGDTIQVIEWVFHNISDKILQVIPKSPYDSINVHFTRHEVISEQFNHKLHEGISREEWFRSRVYWQGNTEFSEMDRKGNVFRIPLTNSEKQEAFRKQQMNLRDTLINLSGESWNVATLIYKEVPCTYVIDRVIIKIEVFAEEKKETKFVDVILSYGC